tara:strand:+ start:180 stop:305 length:126 start_codon:yes stop_codon:yes gene_type:complete
VFLGDEKEASTNIKLRWTYSMMKNEIEPLMIKMKKNIKKYY